MKPKKVVTDLKNFYILTNALNYIEENLCNPISQEEIAGECFCSLSSLQKMFRYAFNHSLKEYISKRRLTNAAKDIVNTEMTITEIAMKYQYNSPEVFTRAFAKLWATSPSKFKANWKFTEIFPKIIIDYNGGNNMSHKKVDISELYDVLKSKQNTYVLCFDIMELKPINDISYDAGDKAILECLRRIHEAAADDMLLFRIGGDEFALVTGLTKINEVEELAKKVLQRNGNTIKYNEQNIPISMRAGATKFIDKNLRYSQLFADLQNTINTTRDNGKEILIVN